MFTAKRRFKPGVIQQLLEEPYRFQFFQAVRMLELWLKQNGMPPETAVADYIRFENRTSLSFPASELEALSQVTARDPQNVAEIVIALREDEFAHIAITPTFMGFLGGNGALPMHYTERIAEHLRYARDEAPRAFLDTFSNRVVALFYQAWRKYRLEFKYELGGQDHFLPLLLSLAGVGQKNLQNRLVDKTGDEDEGVLDQSLGYYATAIRQHPASASYMAQILSEYFDVAIRLEQFIGHWYTVPPLQQTQLGVGHATLGSDALAGARIWQRDLRLRLLIGPLRKTQFEIFLPGGRAARSLKKMLTMFTHYSLEYEVQLILHQEDVAGVSLDVNTASGRLGWDTFLVTEAAIKDRTDVCYEIHAL